MKSKEQKGLNFGSFVYWARQQNENKYNELFPVVSNNNIDWSRLTEAEYARVLKSLYFYYYMGIFFLLKSSDFWSC